METMARKRLSGVSALVFIIYIYLIIYFVFFSDHYGRVTGFTEYRYNLIPFAEINRYLTYRESFTWENLATNLAGNILIFVPFGMLLPIIRMKKTGFFYVTFQTFLFSCFIETVQLFTKVGVFDVDDLIMNTVGGMIGYLVFYILRDHYRHPHRGRSVRIKKEAVKKMKNKNSNPVKPGGIRQPTAKTFRHSASRYKGSNVRRR